MRRKAGSAFNRVVMGAAVAAIVFVAAPTLGLSGSRAPVSRRLPPPEHVPPATRAELAARMGRHGDTMGTLVRAVILLDRPTIRVLAGRIADEEVVARSGKSPHEPLPLYLPRDFFLQQTKLAVAARDLAAAVVAGADDATLGERFSAVTSTCIGCHSAYLHGQPEGGPFGLKQDERERTR